MDENEYRITGKIARWEEHTCNCDFCEINGEREIDSFIKIDEIVTGMSKNDARQKLEYELDLEHNDNEYGTESGWKWFEGPVIELNNEEGYMLKVGAPTLFAH